MMIISKNLILNMPRFREIIKVIPKQISKKDMKSDPEIEKIGMNLVMDYEKKNNRTPEDVSAQNLGFDILLLLKKEISDTLKLKQSKKRCCFFDTK